MAGGMAQVAEYVPHKHKALSSNASTEKKKSMVQNSMYSKIPFV
jgi:hypothetical protein